MRTMSGAGRWWWPLSCAVALLAAASDLAAQTATRAPTDTLVRVRGRVVDSAGVAVPHALVGIAPAGHSRTSDEQGRFEFVLPRPGTYALRVRVIGYAPASQELTLARGETREVILRLHRFPVILSAVEIHAERHSRQLAGILRRQSVGLGEVLFAEDLARYDYASLAQALENPRLRQQRPPPRHATSGSFRSSCSIPRYFIDGKPRRSRPMPRLEEIEAIEAHRTIDFLKNAAEFSYGDYESGCPIIMIWTKTGLRSASP